jgi:oligopeptide transport system substrate-binding protein
MKILPTALAVFAALSALSCSGGGDKGMAFRYNNGTEPQTLDPAVMTGIPEMRIVQQMFEGLCEYDPKDLHAVPGVAESWSVSPDGLTWTFRLRTNSRWSDGTPVDAETFRWSWLRILSPDTASEYAYELWCIKNAEKFTKKQTNADAVGVIAKDRFTLAVKLAYPVPFFPSLVCHHPFRPTPRQAVDKYGGDQWFKAGKLVANGPFVLTVWKPKDRIVLKKNTNYWDAAKVALDRVEFYPVEDSASALEMYLNGELDGVDGIPSERIDQMKKRPDFLTGPFFGTYYYRFNVKTPTVLTNALVRRALSLSIDRAQICEYIGKLGQKPSLSFTPPLIPGYRPPELVKEDAALAKKLLARAGYPDGKGFPSLTILYNTLEDNRKIAEAIQQMWKKNLGIDVAIENQEWKVYLQKVSSLDYNIARAGWIGDYADPMTFLDMFTADSGNNQSGWASPAYDALLDRAKAEPDAGKRSALMREAETILLTDCPIMPIYTYVRAMMIATNVQGIYDNFLDMHPLKEVRVVR